MNRRLTAALLATVLAASTAGCATVQKKFTRKKKAPERTQSVIYLEEGPHQKKYSNEYYYKTHYTFWSTWQDDLLDNLRDGNKKRLRRAAQEVVSHLAEMSNYLQPEPKAELDVIIARLQAIRERLEAGYYDSNPESLRPEIEQIGRSVAGGYYYSKVKDRLLPDVVDLGGPQA
ncbi:MAG: hypothetical protein MOGMAGMI_01072 [Candidatus Omnitrophica bacterium]|nr:hypothetical protein [Candidatus Omnitrophota bacterium]